jgi:hypothetical protein
LKVFSSRIIDDFFPGSAYKGPYYGDYDTFGYSNYDLDALYDHLPDHHHHY